MDKVQGEEGAPGQLRLRLMGQQLEGGAPVLTTVSRVTCTCSD